MLHLLVQRKSLNTSYLTPLLNEKRSLIVRTARISGLEQTEKAAFQQLIILCAAHITLPVLVFSKGILHMYQV